MILSEYEAKRGELEKEMEKLNAMESEKKMELSIKHQTELKKIASQIGQLKKKRADVQNQYQKDKSWWHAKFRTEKKRGNAEDASIKVAVPDRQWRGL